MSMINGSQKVTTDHYFYNLQCSYINPYCSAKRSYGLLLYSPEEATYKSCVRRLRTKNKDVLTPF